LGDAVYLGNEKYELLFFDDEQVKLFDNNFPLINKELSRVDFDRMVRENPFNNHLIVTQKESKTFWEQYSQIKHLQGGNTIILVRVGDFFEGYADDANIMAETLDITLLKKTIDGEVYAMCGFPNHSLESYASQLNESGFSVALIDKENDIYKVYDIINAKKESATITQIEDIPKFDEIDTFISQEIKPINEKKYDLGFGHLGNGVTVWNRWEEENGDYKIVAHIDSNRDITYYEEMPQSVKDQIEFFAKTSDKKISQTQDMPVFKIPSNENTLSIGTELTIDDRKFKVDSIDPDTNSVSLRDITFQNGTGFPIFRKESIDFVRAITEEQEKQFIAPPFENKKTSSRVTTYDIHPEIPNKDRFNYKISNDELGYGGAKEKYRNNI
jgi:hypothetical protein